MTPFSFVKCCTAVKGISREIQLEEGIVEAFYFESNIDYLISTFYFIVLVSSMQCLFQVCINFKSLILVLRQGLSCIVRLLFEI